MSTASLASLGRTLLLASLMLLYSIISSRSFIHLDLARDMRVAADIVDGRHFPLVGPVLAGSIHLGSGWYYLLAIFRLLTHDWGGTVYLLALLSSLQFPLAYSAGKAYAGRSVGICWALLLIIPSWSMLEQVFPTHTQLIGTTTTALLTCSIRYYRRHKVIYLFGAFLALSIGLHAHPTLALMISVNTALLMLAWRRRQLSLGVVVLLVSAVAIPFVPLLVNQWLHGDSFLQSVGGYFASDQFRSSAFGNFLPLLWQLVGGGMRYWIVGVIQRPEAWGWLLALGYATLIAVGAVAAAAEARRGDRLTAVAFLCLILGLLALPGIRSYFPYYMMTALRVVVLGICAKGLVSLLGRARRRRAAGAAFAVACVATYLLVGSAVFRFERGGAWPFAFLPMFDIKSAWQPVRPLALMSARGMAASGRWLCSADRVSAHGAYAVHLLHSYVQEARFYCDDADVALGGGDPLRQHWLGLSAAMAKEIGRDDGMRLGPFRLFQARRIIGDPEGVASPSRREFPPIKVERSIGETAAYADQIGRGEYLSVTYFGFGFMADPEVRVIAGSSELRPMTSDLTTAIYSCGECDSQQLRVELRGRSLGLVDLVIF